VVWTNSLNTAGCIDTKYIMYTSRSGIEQVVVTSTGSKEYAK